jgi:hypothetical protein
MGLSDDQKALLRLLAGGQGYEDIAALLGTSVDEVKAKATAAVEQLEAEGIPAPTLPGAPTRPAADPAPPSDPPPPPAPPPVPPAPEPPLKPTAGDPEPPSDPPPPTTVAPESSQPATQAPAAAASPSGPGHPKLSLPSDPGKRAALAAGAIVVALIVVVLIVSGGSGGDSDSSTRADATTTTGSTETGGDGESQNAANSSGKVTKAVLTSSDGGDASGVAIFGRVKKALALQIQAQGLEPTSSKDSYTVWVADSPQKMLPLASTAVKKDGRIAAQFEVPVEVLAYLAAETFDQIVVTHTDNAKLQAALKTATKEEQAPTYTGEEVLSGQITGSIIGAQKRIEESEAAKKKE